MKRIKKIVRDTVRQLPKRGIWEGYTLIELLVAFSIMSIIGTISIASFVLYTNSQALKGAATDVSNAYILARQRTLSQIKPSSCTAQQSLSGYNVVLNIVAKTYQLNATCGGSNVVISQKTLPPQITFGASSPVTTVFTSPNGTVNATSTVTLNGFGKTKSIIINTSGVISVQ